jgi:hypothetical protein
MGTITARITVKMKGCWQIPSTQWVVAVRPHHKTSRPAWTLLRAVRITTTTMTT